MRIYKVLGALGIAIAATSPARADKEPPLPDIATARCFETSNMIALYIGREPEVAPDFRGTPWEAPLKLKESIERAEERRGFLRDCAKAGFRLPRTPADEAHNKKLFERLNREFMAQWDAAVMWHYRRRDPKLPSPAAQGVPPIEPSPEEVAMKECADSWIQQVGMPRHVRDQVGGSDGLTYGASLAFRCGKYGFVDARDAAGDEGNRRVWEQVNDRIAELRKKDGRALMRKLVGAP